MNRPSFIAWRPQTGYFVIGGFLILLIAVGIAFMVNSFTPTTELRMGSGIYHLRVADSESERIQGLSGVDTLKPNGGLLMKFDSDNTWGIWMKDMKIPLDIVWLNAEKKIIYIVKNASPELSTNTTFVPKTNARYVVELPAGAVEDAGIRTGMIATFNENDPGGY